MARPKLGDSETERLHIKITADEIEAIDDWRFANRIPSRSEAVRRLVQIGLFVDNELEQIVDVSTATVGALTDMFLEAMQEMRTVLAPDLADIKFGPDEMRDVFDVAIDRDLRAVEGIEGMHSMILTLYNAIAPLAQAATMVKAQEELQQRIDEANKAAEQAAEKLREQEENRYIGILSAAETPEERAAYDALSDSEQDEFWERRIAQLSDEEQADPEAFAEKYKIPKRFWEEPGWACRLRGKLKGNE